MPDSIGTAFVDVAFDPKQVQGQLGGLGGKTEGLFGKLGGAWGAAAATGFGAAVVAGVAVGKYLYDVGSQFDDMADSIRTSTGKTGKQLDSLVDTAKKVGTDVPTSFEDAGKAVANVSTRLDLTGKPLRTVSDQMLELARLSGTDLSSALNSVTRMLGDAGMKGADASKGIDELWRASQATQVPVTRLADLLTKFGGPMRQLGFSFEEQAALLGKFEKEGVNTELVMGSMRIALGKMAKAGKDPQVELRKTMEAIRDTGSQSEANAKAIELFGARAGPDMAAAIREGRFSIDDLVKTISKGHDTVLQAGKDTADFSEQWQIFKNKVAVAVAPAAEALFSGIGEGMAYLNENMGPLMHALQRELGPTIKDLGPVFADLGGILKDLGKVVVDLMPVWRLLADVVELSAKRIIETIKGVAEVLGGVVKVVRALLEGDWRGAWDGAKQIVQGFADIFKAQLDYIKSLLELVTRPIRQAAAALGDAIKSGIVDGVTGIGAFISSTLGGIREAIANAVSGAGNAARAVGNAIKSGVQDGVTGVGAFIASTVSGVVDAVRNAVAGAGKAASAVGSAIKSGVQDGVSGVGAFVTSTVQGIVEAVRGAVANAAAAARAVGSAIKDGVVGAVTGVGGAVANLVGQIAGVVRGVVGAAASAAQAVGSAIKDGIVGGIAGIADAVAGSLSGVDDAVRRIVGAAGAAARAIGEAIYNGVMGPIQGLVGDVESVIDRVKSIASSVGGVVSHIPGLRSAPPPPEPAPGPAPAPQAGLLAAPAAYGSTAAGGTLYGRRSPFAGLERALTTAVRAAGAVQEAGPTVVRVYIGDEELRGIVRTEVGYADDQTARVILAGARA